MSLLKRLRGWRDLAAETADLVKSNAAQLNQARQQLAQLQDHLARVEARVATMEFERKIEPCGIPVADGRILTKTFYGAKLYVNATDRLMAPRFLLDRHFEPEISLYFDQNVSTGQTFIDVGANVGYYACAAARKVGPAGRVFAYEADPMTWELLRDNALLNDVNGWMSSCNLCIGGHTGVTKLFRRTRYQGNTGAARVSAQALDALGDQQEEIDVETQTLDALFANDERPVDWVKIDVEGGEYGVLRGMRGLVRRNPKIQVVLEWAQWAMRANGVTPEQMWEEIEALGLAAFHVEGNMARTTLDAMRENMYCNLLLRKG